MRAIILALLAVVLAAPAAGAAEPQWRGPVLPEPLPGADFSGGLGRTGAPAFWSASRAVISIEGSTSVPKGLYGFDGGRWRLISTVCGANPERTDIAWAGPDEFWVIADPAPDPTAPPADFGPYQPRDEGTTLCHFKGDRFVASYGVPVSAIPRWHPLTAATCRAPDDCWFAGNAVIGAPGGEGTFMLHWDGRELKIHWARPARGVSDMAVFEGEVWQSNVFGLRPDRREPPVLLPGEAPDRLLRRLEPGGATLVDPFVAAPRAACSLVGCGSLPEDELLALDAHGDALWAVGGGASSGSLLGGGWGQRVPPSQSDGNGELNPRYPLAAIRAGGRWHQLRFDAAREAASFGVLVRFADVAAIPGRRYEAWVAVESYHGQNGGLEYAGERLRYQLTSPVLARIAWRPEQDAQAVNAEILEVVQPSVGIGLGGARHVACPAPDDCWAVTREGWFLHWSDGTETPRDAASPFAGVIGERPADGRTRKPVPDTPPLDDSLAFAPQPQIVELPLPQPSPGPAPPAKRLKLQRLVAGVRTNVLGATTLRVRFRLARPARVAVETTRRKRGLKRSRAHRLEPGDRELRISFARAAVPDGLNFLTEELAPTAPTLRASARGGKRGTRVTARLPEAGTLSLRMRAGKRTLREVVTRKRAGTVAVTLPARAGLIDLRFDGAERVLRWTLRVESK